MEKFQSVLGKEKFWSEIQPIVSIFRTLVLYLIYFKEGTRNY